MRDPDDRGRLERQCDALRWLTLGPQLVAQMGVPQTLAEASAMKVADEELEVWAWHVRFRALAPHESATVAYWLVNGPYHPHWRWWAVAAVHLRVVPGVDPPQLSRPDASHEIVIYSIDPTGGDPDVDAIESGERRLKMLTPIDLAYQVAGLSDEQAGVLVQLMVRSMMAGWMSPDQDFRGAWPNVIDATVEHIRFGGHPSRN